MDDGSLSGEYFETKDVGCGTALKWLIYKNFKQQFMRRPCALACKLLCPALCIIILGIIRGFFKAEAPFIYYPTETNDVTQDSIQPENWINSAICYNNDGGENTEEVFYIYI